MSNVDCGTLGGDIATSTELLVSWPHDAAVGGNGTETHKITVE